MKKILFTAAMSFFCVIISASAQSLCSNCGGETKIKETPSVFNPVPIGTSGYGVGYLKDVPVNSSRRLTLYVYMVDANGKLIEIPVSGEIITPPSSWLSYFLNNYNVIKEQYSERYVYNIPKEINFRIDVKPAGEDMSGQPIKGPDGNIIGIQRITILL